MNQLRILLLLFVLLFSVNVARAQVTTGTPPFGSFAGGPDTINLGNLNVHWVIPVLQRAGRGTDFSYALTYDNSVWTPVNIGGTVTWMPTANFGWDVSTQVVTGYVSYFATSGICFGDTGKKETYTFNTSYAYVDSQGTSHSFPTLSILTSVDPQGCSGLSGDDTAVALDGSGYSIDANKTSATITKPNGTVFSPPLNVTSGAAKFTDRNGNIINADGSGHYYDTLSSTTPVLTVTGSGTPSSPVKLTYTAPSGGSPYYQVNYTNYTVATNFGVSGIKEYKSTAVVPLPTSIVLPDNSQYTFTYEPTPSTPAIGACTPIAGTTCTTARVTSVTLPTGGTISYNYYNLNNNFAACTTGYNGIFADGSASCLQRGTPDTAGSPWLYTRAQGTGAASTITVTDPQSNVTTAKFQGNYEVQRVVNQGSSTVLQTTNTCYNGASIPCTGTAITLPITSRTVSSVLAGSGNLTDQHVASYDNYGNLLGTSDYDYGSGAKGNLLAQSTITYASLGNITAFQKTVTVTNSSGQTVSKTNYNYDETAVVATSGTPQHTSVSGSRGNLTSVNAYATATTYLTSKTSYYDTGNPYQVTDVNNGVTTYNYHDATSTCGNAFPTGIAESISTLTTSFSYNCTGGVQTSFTDENSNPTATSYTDRYFWRPASVSYADGGITSWTYNSSTSVTTTVKMNSSQNVVSTTLLDGLGRTNETQLTSDPIHTDYMDTTYDSLGRVYKVSNPYRFTSDSTYGSTIRQYDALSRLTLVIPPDGSQSSNNVSISYANNCATTTDQAAKKRTTCSNSLGYLTQVFEDSSGLNYETDYTVNPLGNTLNVTQKGGASSSSWRTRSYAYDFLSRLKQSTNPESGTVNYYYDQNGYTGDLTSRVAPAPNQTGSSTVTTTYTYDALHRLTQKSYSDGGTAAPTPSANYIYDLVNPWGTNHPTNYLGHLSETSTTLPGKSLASGYFWYDPVGRVVLKADCTPANCPSYPGFHTSYSYDLTGDLLSYGTSENGITFSYTYDAAGRQTNMTSSLSDAQHPATLATVDSSIGYYPQGSIRKMLYGNGLTQTAAFNNSLQPCRVNLNSSSTALGACPDSVPSGNLLDITAGFNLGTSNNGNVASLTAVGQQTFNRTYSYDSLNRLSSMADSASGQNCKGLSWTYDAWGNLWSQNNTSGSCLTFSAGVATNNQFTSPYTYDAAGNVTSDGTNHYYYDAENRLIQVNGTLGNCSTATACYQYDALGNRIEKIVGSAITQYVFDPGGTPILETNGVGNGGALADYMYLNGVLVAEYKNGTTYFPMGDHLSSTRLVTGMNQSVVQNLDFYPYGQLNSSDSGIISHKFTGDERDAETALDHTSFRQYASNQFRWLTPDPADLAAVDPTNPQSLNRYAYVINNPCSLTDPLGLKPKPCSFKLTIAGNGFLSSAQLKALQTSLAAIFATAGVGVSFNFTGTADFTLSIIPSSLSISSNLNGVDPPTPNSPSSPQLINAFGYDDPAGQNRIMNHGYAYFDRPLGFYGLSSSSVLLGTVLGRIGAHEAGHYLVNMSHNPPPVSGLGGVMDEHMDALNPNLGFTGGQSIQLQDRCRKMHGTGGGSASDSGTGGGGGQWVFWQPVLYGPEGNTFLGAGQWIWWPGGGVIRMGVN